MKNKYNFFFKKSLHKTKLNWWLTNRPITKHLTNSTLVIPKGLFFRLLRCKENYIGTIVGGFVTTKRPFVRPLKIKRR